MYSKNIKCTLFEKKGEIKHLSKDESKTINKQGLNVKHRYVLPFSCSY